MHDWDTFYFEHWVENHDDDDEPTWEDYQDWLLDRAESAFPSL